MRENGEEEMKFIRSPRATKRETAYFPSPTIDKELKELAAKFSHVPIPIIRKNPEICAEYVPLF